MIELRSVVAATDLSAPARRAVDRAAWLARSASASLTLVHVFSGTALDELGRWLDTDDGGAVQSIHDDVRERLRELACELAAARAVDEYRAAARSDAKQRMRELALRAGFADCRWTALAPDGGEPWISIIRHEQEQDCDLVVVGKHGRSAVEDLLLGGTTNRVTGESSSDVLVCTREEVR